MFERLKKLAGDDGELILGLNSSEFILNCKGKLPYYDYHQRMLNLKTLPTVDDVVANVAGADLKPTLQLVKPDILAVGSDWHYPKDYLKQINVTFKWLAMNGILLVYVPSLEREHSSDIRKSLWKV